MASRNHLDRGRKFYFHLNQNRPESHYWSVLISGYRKIVDPTEDNDLDRLAEAFWRGEKCDNAQLLYDRYADSICESLDIAKQEDWYWQEKRHGGPRLLGIGISGVMVVWDSEAVVSAMLMLKDIKKNTSFAVSHNDRLSNPRPRSNQDSGTHPKIPKFFPADNEKTRYKLFEKCWRSVSRQYLTASRKGRVVKAAPRLCSEPMSLDR